MHLTQTDRMHVLRKLAIHRLVSRTLRSPAGDTVFALAEDALDELEKHHGRTAFVGGWRDLMRLGRAVVAERIIARDDHMTALRDTSPFMRLWGVGLGDLQEIDLRDAKVRDRLWKLASRLVMIEPHRPEVRPCPQVPSPR